jgi:hypothetical protein
MSDKRTANPETCTTPMQETPDGTGAFCPECGHSFTYPPPRQGQQQKKPTKEDLAFSAGRLAGTTWLPIESAPKDGTAILGLAGKDMATVAWYSPDGDCGYWSLIVCGGGCYDSEWNPTHWMPLPEKPTQEEGKRI